jgi:hypothetical protein
MHVGGFNLVNTPGNQDQGGSCGSCVAFAVAAAAESAVAARMGRNAASIGRLSPRYLFFCTDVGIYALQILLVLERSCAYVIASVCFIVHSSFFVACRLCLLLGWLIPSEMVTGPTCNYSLSHMRCISCIALLCVLRHCTCDSLKLGACFLHALFCNSNR